MAQLTLNTGGEEPFWASSYTTAVPGDITATFPAPELERLYHAAYSACGA
ncbi:MAG: hypothetical protein HY784_04390 [Chloroflexi bacterium]|nr:hypothetical protein [Chloroflexota bacterium]